MQSFEVGLVTSAATGYVLIFIRLTVYDVGLDEYWVTPCFILGLILGCEALYGMGGAWGLRSIGIFPGQSGAVQDAA